MKTVKIGLLGLGNVGLGTYKIFEMNREHIEKVTGVHPVISKVLVNDVTKDRGIKIPEGVLTSRPEDILEDPEICIVAEALGGIEPAAGYMKKALENGKHVVTANKAALAANFKPLRDLAEAKGLMLRYEASVGGAIPVMAAVRSQLQANDFSEVMGIVNGTTNYILTKMTEEGAEYADALKKAQELGFAEADPTADVEGIDAANKLCILMGTLFDKYVEPAAIPRTGITGVTKKDIDEAKERGEVIKLIAGCKRDAKGDLTFSVEPKCLPAFHPLAGVSNEFNAIYITGNAAGEMMFYGRGAGSLPTGSAVAGDIVDILGLLFG